LLPGKLAERGALELWKVSKVIVHLLSGRAVHGTNPVSPTGATTLLQQGFDQGFDEAELTEDFLLTELGCGFAETS
jgi:hypothetical protein